MNKRFILPVIFLLSVLLLLCSCKERDKNITSSDNTVTNSSLEQVSANLPQNDSIDPQNTELKTESGSRVKAESISGNSGTAMGIDVSKWQGKIDWKKVKNSGIDFAIIRVGYRAENGEIYKDANADYNIQQADKNGILVGVYFFSTAINTDEALAEAKWTADFIAPYPISYPVVYDCEGFNDADSRMYGLTNSARSTNASVFLHHMESLGYEGMLYSSKSDLISAWETATIEKDFGIWIARYTTPAYPETAAPDYSGKYDMWQFTNKGIVNGIEGNTDMVVSFFTRQKATPKSNKTVMEAAPPVAKDDIYTAQSGTVTAKDIVNLRDGATTNSNIIGTLKNGDTLQRTAVGTNGWSKLLYNGQTVYAISSYLTTDLSAKPPVTVTDEIYKTVNESVTAKESTNLRTNASTSNSEIVYTLKNGETVTRTGIGENGWSRLIYNGQTVYAITSYLTNDLSYKPPVSSEETTADNEMPFTTVSEQVTAKSETNLRTKPTTNEGSEVVYTLKNGEYVERIGVSDSGWSKLLYNGQTVYAVSSFLTN